MALKVGILGAGHMGSVHAGILARDDRVKITAVADLLPERRGGNSCYYEVMQGGES